MNRPAEPRKWNKVEICHVPLLYSLNPKGKPRVEQVERRNMESAGEIFSLARPGGGLL